MSNSEITKVVLTVDGLVLKKNDDGTDSQLSSQTNWDYVNSMSDEEITANSQVDPDNPEWSVENWEQVGSQRPLLKTIHFCIDEDSLLWFKSYGDEYQTKINKVLRDFMEDQQ